MKKISIVFLAAVSLATFGCKKKGGADVVAKMGEFKDRMCACKDKACGDKVSDDMIKWSSEVQKSDKDGKGGTEEETKKVVAISEDMSKCQQKLNAPDGAAPPAGGAAAPPAGGADPGSAAAAPPAGGADPGSAAAPPAAGSDTGSAK